MPIGYAPVVTILPFRASRSPGFEALVEAARGGGWYPMSLLRDALRKTATSRSSRDPRALASFLESATPGDWLVIDAAVRTPELYGAQRKSLLEHVGHDLISIGLSSMDASGYRRADAIQRLREATEPLAGPFLALRCVDWVEPVAIDARAALLEVTRRETKALLLAAPLVMALAKRSRAAGLIDEFFRPTSADPNLQRALLGLSSSLVRRQALDLALAADTLPLEELIRLAREDDDTYVVRHAGKRAVEAARHADLTGPLMELLDGRAVVRRAVVDALPNEERWRGLGMRLLLDRSPMVRAGAQGLLRRLDQDPAQLYRDAIGGDHRPAIAVLELGLLGTRSDVPLLLEILSAKAPSMRRAAVLALRRLLGEEAVSLIQPVLQDASPSVVTAVERSLRPSAKSLPGAELRDLARSAAAHVRKAALRLLRRRATWERLEADIAALADPDETIRRHGEADLVAWVRRDAARAQRADAETRFRLAQDLDAVAERLDPRLIQEIKFHAGLRAADLR